MKIKQRIIAILTTLAMSAAMVMPVGIYQPVTVSADTTVTITPPANEDSAFEHTYKAYKLLAGTVEEKDSKKYLSVTGWGDGISTPDALVTALGADNTTKAVFTSDKLTAYNYLTTDADKAAYFAALLSAKSDDAAFANAFSKVVKSSSLSTAAATSTANKNADNKITSYTLSLPSEGYYLVIDESNLADTTDTALSNFILQVINKDENFAISAKTDVPTIKKTITKIEGTDTGVTPEVSYTLDNIASTYDAATACIGDTITYTLTSPVPDMSAYDSYYFEMQDTLSTGLTFKEFSEVKIGDATLDSSKYTATHTEGSITIKIDDLKALNPDAVASITATYTATLNANAVIYNQVTAEGAEKGNVNSAALVYSNDPNSTSHGTTHPDITKVYTTEIVIRKIDGNTKEPLTGAVFELQLEYATDTYKTIDTKTVENADGTITFTGLGAGTYKVVETKAPDGGYNKVNTDVVITATPTLEGVEWSYNSTESNIITVENKRGLILPSTGGIGTTIFYVIGGGIIIAAVILFVVRRKSAK